MGPEALFLAVFMDVFVVFLVPPSPGGVSREVPECWPDPGVVFFVFVDLKYSGVFSNLKLLPTWLWMIGA